MNFISVVLTIIDLLIALFLLCIIMLSRLFFISFIFLEILLKRLIFLIIVPVIIGLDLIGVLAKAIILLIISKDSFIDSKLR